MGELNQSLNSEFESMKSILFTIFVFLASTACDASDGPAQPRRAPYKEVRTKHNQDPAVKEAIRAKLKREHEARIEHRKKIEAQMRFGGAKPSTNSVTSTNAPVKSEKAVLPSAPKAAVSSEPKPK